MTFWDFFKKRSKTSLALSALLAGALSIAVSLKKETQTQEKQLQKIVTEIKKNKEIPENLPSEIKIKSSTTWEEALTQISTDAQLRVKQRKEIDSLISDFEFLIKENFKEDFEVKFVNNADKEFLFLKSILKLTPSELASIRELFTKARSANGEKRETLIDSIIDELGLNKKVELMTVWQYNNSLIYNSDSNPKNLNVRLLLFKKVKTSLQKDISLLQENLTLYNQYLQRIQKLIPFAENENLDKSQLNLLYDLETRWLERKASIEDAHEHLRILLEELETLK